MTAYTPYANQAKPGMEGVTPSGLCGCFEDCQTCCLAWCCPVCMLGWNGAAIKNWEQGPPDGQPIWRTGSFSCLQCLLSWCCPCFGCYFLYTHRGSMHAILGEPQNCCADCCACWCCPCCSQAQVGRQLKKVRKTNMEQGAAGSIHFHYYDDSGKQSQPLQQPQQYMQPAMAPPQQMQQPQQYMQPAMPPPQQYMQPQQQPQYTSPSFLQQQQPQQQPQYTSPSFPQQQQQQQFPHSKGIN